MSFDTQGLIIAVLIGLNVFGRYYRQSNRKKSLGDVLGKVEVSIYQRFVSQLLNIVLLGLIAFLFVSIENYTMYDYIFYGAIILLLLSDVVLGLSNNLEVRERGVCYQQHEYTFEAIESVELHPTRIDIVSSNHHQKVYTTMGENFAKQLPKKVRVER